MFLEFVNDIAFVLYWAGVVLASIIGLLVFIGALALFIGLAKGLFGFK